MTNTLHTARGDVRFLWRGPTEKQTQNLGNSTVGQRFLARCFPCPNLFVN